MMFRNKPVSGSVTDRENRVNRVINGLMAFAALDRWVENGVMDEPAPNLSCVDKTLTPEKLAGNQSVLLTWSDMFQKSLDAYRDLVEMSQAEWDSFSNKQIAGLEKMLKTAAYGVKIWL